jgi:GT2 family glycosyltransferase
VVVTASISATNEPLGTSVRILAIVVLYRHSIKQSASVTSLMGILTERPEWRERFCLIFYDNSPEPQGVPEDLPVQPIYVHDRNNGGLAPAYQHALDMAVKHGIPWLLLLDQDTTLTPEFLAEALTRSLALESQTEIGGMAPKLVSGGAVYSPESEYLYQLRRQFRRQKHRVTIDALGVQTRPMNAYNSGAVLRVAALQAIGGFPQDFWLDYLDHAVFQELQHHGYQLFVMKSVLEHDLSHLDPDAVPLWRRRSVLTAQTRYVRRYGGWRERMWFRVSLLRGAGRAFTESRHRVLWKEILLQIIVLRVPSIRLGK